MEENLRSVTETNLRSALENRRMAAGSNGRPMGYKRWGGVTNVDHTTLWRFANGQKALGIEALRSLAQVATSANDNEMLLALAGYALGVPVDN